MVTETEWQRLPRDGAVVLREVELAVFEEARNRFDVAAVEAEFPFVFCEIAIRNAGIVLENDLAVGEKETANLGEVIFGMHEIGRRLQKRHAVPLLFAKLHEVRVYLDRPVSQVGHEIVERLRMSGRSGEGDLYPGRSSFPFGDEGARLIE